ncbi:hypothetical protein [Bifidobacterium actinocoloniiforme]|uniref:hypothetical protein n=1 Tax=Bifidobacterium actinocoloniiforme TaxID=638619 RepID=UPI000A50A11B|nr:hypothetical protein [Bifidobacterium actinocoloniiforme]
MLGPGTRPAPGARKAPQPDLRRRQGLPGPGRGELARHPGPALPGPRDPRPPQGAASWLALLNHRHLEHGHSIKERALASGDPHHPKALAGRKWRCTHERPRRAHLRLDQLNRQGSLLAFTDPDLTGKGPVQATSDLVGSINAAVRGRTGCSEEHVRRIVERTIYLAGPGPDPMSIMRQGPKPATRKRQEERPSPYGTATIAEEGLHTRKGWAGRSAWPPTHGL